MLLSTLDVFVDSHRWGFVVSTLSAENEKSGPSKSCIAEPDQYEEYLPIFGLEFDIQTTFRVRKESGKECKPDQLK
jgi:hypothetical protein